MGFVGAADKVRPQTPESVRLRESKSSVMLQLPHSDSENILDASCLVWNKKRQIFTSTNLRASCKSDVFISSGAMEKRESVTQTYDGQKYKYFK